MRKIASLIGSLAVGVLLTATGLIFDAQLLLYAGICLLALAVVLWLIGWGGRLQAEPKPSLPAVDQSVTSNNQSGGITAHTVNVGRPRLEVTADLIEDVARQLDLNKPVGLVWRNKGRGQEQAMKLRQGLEAKGFVFGPLVGFGEISGVEFERQVTVSPDGFRLGGLEFVGGYQAVAVEPDANA